MVTTLNPRQLLFARNVIQGMTLTAAYREAGYSGEGHVAHAGASKLMAKPAIAAFIEAHQQQATLSAIADRREILGRLTKVLRSESADLDSGDLPIHEVSRRTIFKSDGTQITRVRSKSMSRHAAIQQLTRMLGLKKPHRDDHYQIAHQKDVARARATVAAVLGEEDANPDPPNPAAAENEFFVLQIGRHLNSRQRLFCEYLARDIPATNAYRLAGYGFYQDTDHASAAASRLLKRPAVIAYLRDLRDLRDLRRHTAPPNDPAGDFANRDETLAYLTQALRASRPDIETQGRFIDQVVHDEIEKSDGHTETRILVKSISQPRAMTQLASLLDSGDDANAEDEDEETRLTRLEMAAMFADPGPTLPADEDRFDISWD
jgi:phage terminase small subunit